MLAKGKRTLIRYKGDRWLNAWHCPYSSENTAVKFVSLCLQICANLTDIRRLSTKKGNFHWFAVVNKTVTIFENSFWFFCVCRKHPCPQCKAIFHTSFGLSKHQTIHSGVRKHVCEQCGKTYRMLDSLKAHRKRHLDPTIPCVHCTKLFYTKNELKSHTGLHTGIKAFKCDLYTDAFIASSSLAAHRRKHKKENLLPTCKLCGTQFNDRVLLRMHLNDHEKDSPFDWNGKAKEKKSQKCINGT